MEYFLHKFETEKSDYVYDARTNQIFRVNRKETPLQQLLYEIDKYYDSADENPIKHFSGINEVTFPVDDNNQIIDKIENEMFELVLNVTEECNFRCSYCIYSGKYEFERSHSNKKMDISIAKKGIDLFFKHNSRNNPVYVGFYGGEPLAAYDVIQQSVEYIKRNYPYKDVIFGMTTNGSLLTSEKIEFLTKNNFNLLISLDGPEAIHNRNRRFSGGAKSYEIVRNNLRKIKNYSKNLYENIGFVATILDIMELGDVSNFFKEDELTRDHRVIISSVSPFDTQVIVPAYHEEEISKLWRNLANEYSDAIIHGVSPNPFLQRVFDLGLKTINERDLGTANQKIPLMGACVPGNRKIFVSTEGKIQICERVGRAFDIGDVENGMDYDKIFDLIKDYKDLIQECSECWAIRLCKPCFVHFRKDDKFDANRKEEVCEDLRGHISRSLSIYTNVFEESPSALGEYFKKSKFLSRAF